MVRRGGRAAGSFASFVTFLSNKEKLIILPKGEMGFVRRGEFVRSFIHALSSTALRRSPPTFCTRNAFRVGIMCGGSLTVAPLPRREPFGTPRTSSPTNPQKPPTSDEIGGFFISWEIAQNRPCRFALLQYKQSLDRQAASGGRCPLKYWRCPQARAFLRRRGECPSRRRAPFCRSRADIFRDPCPQEGRCRLPRRA